MLKRSFPLLLLACLTTGALWAANRPFVGEWAQPVPKQAH